MKLKQRLIKKVIADEYVYVSVKSSEDSYEGIITVTESGAVLLDTLTHECDREMLIKALTDVYDIDAQTAAKDVDDFVKKIREKGLISD